MTPEERTETLRAAREYTQDIAKLFLREGQHERAFRELQLGVRLLIDVIEDLVKHQFKEGA